MPPPPRFRIVRSWTLSSPPAAMLMKSAESMMSLTEGMSSMTSRAARRMAQQRSFYHDRG